MNNLSLIITDLLFGTEIHGFIFDKGTAWLRMDINTALRDYGLLAQVHGLVCSAVTSRVYTFSIVLSKYSLYPSRSPAVSF